MKKSLSLSFIFLLFAGVAIAQQGVVFEKNWKAAVTRAKAEGKMLFVDVYTEWCGPCKRLASEVFPLKAVGDYMNAHFVSVKVDAEREGSWLNERHEVKSYPTFLMLDSSGRHLLAKRSGAPTTGKGFLHIMEGLKLVADLKLPEIQQKQSVKQNKKSGK